MSATAWLVIAIIGFSLAGVALVVVVFMFVSQNIPSVIGDLTGKTVAREIKAMREFNKANGDRRFRPSDVNLERGILTEKVEVSKKDRQAIAQAHLSKRLDKTSLEEHPVDKKLKGRTVGLSNFESTPTDVLNDGDSSTEVLSDNATEVLSDGTTVLSETTTVLNNNIESSDNPAATESFKVTKNKIITYSDEMIE